MVTLKESSSNAAETIATVHPVKKPTRTRKKSQAFNTPKNAAVKTLIARNAAQSPLLRLPREVRDRIWKHMIGNRVLHIERQACDKHNIGTRQIYQTWECTTMKWVTTCCIEPFNEEEIFEQSKEPAFRSVGHPHRLCRQMIYSIRVNQHDVPNSPELTLQRRNEQVKDHVLPVQILRVCRQAYIEANPIMWLTNTMSFPIHHDCNPWMADRLTAQKALITSLHLDVIAGFWSADLVSFGAGAQSIIKSLKGLKSLHLYLPDTFVVKDRFKDARLNNYQQLRLEVVTVVVIKRRMRGRSCPIPPSEKCVRYTEERRQELLA